MSEQRLAIVTIDGPAGVGKSTISRLIADQLAFTYLDTGSMYRALAYELAKTQKATGKSVQELVQDDHFVEQVQALELELLPPLQGEEYGRVRIGKQVLGSELRAEEMGQLASEISALAQVRSGLTAIQQRMGAAGKVVAEGRDTGTVVFPLAAWKFFLDATPEERARRRIRQLRAGGAECIDEAALLANLLARDRADRNRVLAPLQPAEDAYLVDTSLLSINEVVNEILQHIRSHPL
ncbi:MAG: (d)CMP kinase [Desulfobulbaceae bacterium]|nr:(d)CMP kinase [Desulfobulbaceae bacterium]